MIITRHIEFHAIFSKTDSSFFSAVPFSKNKHFTVKDCDLKVVCDTQSLSVAFM